MKTPQHSLGPRRGPSNDMRAQLVSHSVRSVVLPVAVLGGVALFVLTSLLSDIETNFTRTQVELLEDVADTKLATRASGAALQIDAFLGERMAEATAWASHPAIVAAARAAHDRHVAEGFTKASSQALEDRFRIDKSLAAWPTADAYLRRQIASSAFFARSYFTDRNGFNVALTHPPGDFVQSDEDWWQSAWRQGVSAGDISYDESSRLWSMDLSVRIDEPVDKKPVGVMKAVLSIEPIQEVADRIAQDIPAGRVLIADRSGALIAETSSGHARERILNPELGPIQQSEPSLRAAFGSERAGFSVGRNWLTGYAHIGERATQISASNRLEGLDWLVVVQQPVATTHAALPMLSAAQNALSDWHRILVFALGGAVLLTGAAAIGLAVGTARRYASRLQAVCDLAEHTAHGADVTPAVIDRPVEIAQLNDAVSRLSEALKRRARAER